MEGKVGSRYAAQSNLATFLADHRAARRSCNPQGVHTLAGAVFKRSHEGITVVAVGGFQLEQVIISVRQI